MIRPKGTLDVENLLPMLAAIQQPIQNFWEAPLGSRAGTATAIAAFPCQPFLRRESDAVRNNPQVFQLDFDECFGPGSRSDTVGIRKIECFHKTTTRQSSRPGVVNDLSHPVTRPLAQRRARGQR